MSKGKFKPVNPFSLNSSPEEIRLVVLMDVRFPLSLRKVGRAAERNRKVL